MDAPRDLIAGYQRFREAISPRRAERYRALARVQKPRTMVIGCADSRADPATIFSAAPGELFVLRNIAALAPPFEQADSCLGVSAAIEFAVTVLEVENIVVLGHGMCGGIALALGAADQRAAGRFVEPWVGLAAGPRSESRGGRRIESESLRKASEWDAIKTSLSNLKTFPFIAEAVDGGRLALHGAWFSIADAELRWLDRRTGVFEKIALG